MRKLGIILLLLACQAWPATTCHVMSAAGALAKTGNDYSNPCQWQTTSGCTVSTLTTGHRYYLVDSTSLTATLTGVTVIDGTAKTVTRAAGSWIVDGVTTGHMIHLYGTSTVTNSQYWFAVSAVSATVLTLTDSNSMLQSESSSSGAVSYLAVNWSADKYATGTVAVANVTIVKATNADHGQDASLCSNNATVVAGYNNSTQGSGVAYFAGGTAGILWTSSTGITISGNNSPANNGYGIVLDGTHTSTLNSIKAINAASNSTYTYVEAFMRGNPAEVLGNFEDVATLTGNSNILFDHVYFHESSDCILTYSGTSSITIQYSTLSDDFPGGSIHGGGTCGNASSNVSPVSSNFKAYYNHFRNITGTAYHDVLSSAPTAPFAISNVQVATNVVTINGGTFGGVPPVGRKFYVVGLADGNNTWLNTTVLTVVSATTTRITATVAHADYGPVTDTGSLVVANDVYELVGNTYNNDVGKGATPGNGFFLNAYLSPGGMAVTNFKFNNNTGVNLKNATFGVTSATSYISGSLQNNLFINTTNKLQIPAASSNFIVTEGGNSAYCAGVQASCYPAALSGITNGVNSDEVLNSTPTPLTGASFPTSNTIFNLSGHTTTGNTLAFTDPSGLTAPQGGIYDRGAFLFAGTAPPWTVTIGTNTGNATGTVTGDDGMNCTIPASPTAPTVVTCSENHNTNDTPTYTATAVTGAFIGWTGGGCSGTGTCKPTVTSNTGIQAQFSLVPTVAISGPAVACAGSSFNLVITGTNFINQAGSAWFITDDLGNTVGGCSYPLAGSCSFTSFTGAPSPLPSQTRTYTVSGVTGGVPTAPASATVNVSCYSQGPLSGASQ